ncbi:MAG: hypothetical protein H6908_02890 [Hyphomicrobiales bacterium]|nr:hypothetical protein [Hyphomicrobiales bacterium]
MGEKAEKLREKFGKDEYKPSLDALLEELKEVYTEEYMKLSDATNGITKEDVEKIINAATVNTKKAIEAVSQTSIGKGLINTDALDKVGKLLVLNTYELELDIVSKLTVQMYNLKEAQEKAQPERQVPKGEGTPGKEKKTDPKGSVLDSGGPMSVLGQFLQFTGGDLAVVPYPQGGGQFLS